MNKKNDEFVNKNSNTLIYKASWNLDWSKIKYWFVDKSIRTLKASDVAELAKNNYKIRWVGAK